MDQLKRLMATFSSMKTLRSPHVDVWRKCFQYTYPARMAGWYDDVMFATEIQDRKAELTDTTTIEATRIFISHLIEGMTPANTQWFGLDVGKESDEERAWLASRSRFIWENIHNSNFDSLVFELMIDAVCAGWFVPFITEKNGGGYFFEQWPLAECYIAASKAGHPVDTVYREFSLNYVQIINEFGDNALSDDAKKAANAGNVNQTFPFLHVIEPRVGGSEYSKFAKNLSFASFKIDLTRKQILSESGFHEFPCPIPRWFLLPGSAYAVGPVSDALPDAATINRIKEYELINLDMAIGGLWIAKDDGVLNPRNIKIGPRRVIVANDVNSMQPLQSSANFNVAFMSEEKIAAQIKRMLLADVLPPNEGQPRTAEEIRMRLQYIRQMLGPTFGRLSNEYLRSMIVRCFGLAYRSGVLGKAPDSLQDRQYTVSYEGPLARAQKLADVAAIDNYAGGLAGMAELKPEILDNIDLDAAARYRADALGVPSDLIPSKDVIAEIREQRAQQQQQAQQQQFAQNVAEQAAPDIIKGRIAS